MVRRHAYNDLIPDGPWFQWHYDGWRLPPEATELGRNLVTSQAFRLNRNLAVQFHPEITPEILAGWLDNGGEAEVRALGLDPQQLLDQTERFSVDSRPGCHRLVDGFLDAVAVS